jgi:hypothetical protein
MVHFLQDWIVNPMLNSEMDHDLPESRTRDFWSSSQHTQPLHHLGCLKQDAKHLCKLNMVQTFSSESHD